MSNEEKSGLKHWVPAFVLMVCVVLAFFDKISIAVLFSDPHFQSSMGIAEDKAKLGWLMTSFLLAYGFSSVFLSFLGDIFNPKKMLFWSVTSWGLLMLCMGFTTSYSGMLILRVLLGLAEGPLFALAYTIVKQRGSRLFPVQAPNQNIHSLAGAIGLGLATAIGASIANPDKKVIGLVGDGGLMLGIGEIATMVQEDTNMVLMIMNDGGYGVMRGIQNNYFGGRQYFNELHTPDYKLLGESMGVKSWKVGSAEEFKTVIQEAVAFEGPTVIELDMNSIGPLNFAGPPQKKLY